MQTIKHHTKELFHTPFSKKMKTLLLLLSLLANLTGLLGKWHESQMKTSSSLCESFGTDGRYNIQLMFASDGEAFIEVVKDPLFRREPSIQIECAGKQGKMRKWATYEYNKIHNYRQSLGIFADNSTLQCKITINTVSHILTAERVSKPKQYRPIPVYSVFDVAMLHEDDLNNYYEWINDPLTLDNECQAIADKIAKEPTLPDKYQRQIEKTIGNKKVHISLTTSPGRLLKLHYVLRSLPFESVETIFVTLPRLYKGKERYRIPKELLKEFPNLQFLTATYDIGPSLKAVGAAMYLQQRGMNDDILIVIDDDNVYGPSMVDSYTYFSLKYPNAVFTATHLTHITTFGFPSVKAIDDPLLRPCYIIEGFSGYASRVKHFDTELIIAFVQRNINPALSVCYLADDVVISFAFALQGIPLQTTWTENTPFYMRSNREELPYFKDSYALHLTNSDDSKSQTVNNDPKYYAAIEIMARYTLNWNTPGMQFRHRKDIIALLNSSAETN